MSYGGIESYAQGIVSSNFETAYYALAVEDPIGYKTAEPLASGKISISKHLPNLISPYLSAASLLIFAGALAAV